MGKRCGKTVLSANAQRRKVKMERQKIEGKNRGEKNGFIKMPGL
jgi:hypothetical protein